MRVSTGWFHRYPARFAPEVVESMLDGIKERAGRRPKHVLDPFAGTGTTMAVARRRGITSTGIELSQLGVLIARLRLEPPDDVDAAVARGEEWAESTTSERITVSAELVEWIGEGNAATVSGYLRRLRALRDEKLQRFMTVAVSSALRPASRWLPGSIKPQVDPSRQPQAIADQLRRAVRRLGADCRGERSGSAAAHVLVGTARKIPLAPASVDAVLTSPPYYVTYDYLDVQRLSYLAFGWPWPAEEQIGRRYYVSPDGIGFSPPRSMEEWYARTYRSEQSVLGRALRAYLQDMRAHFQEVTRVLKPGGAVAYAVGNSTRSGKRFDLATTTGELMEEAGLFDIELEPREQSTARRILPAGRDPSTGRFCSEPTPGVDEYVVYARKRPGRRRP
jgi:DNA modification methylase